MSFLLKCRYGTTNMAKQAGIVFDVLSYYRMSVIYAHCCLSGAGSAAVSSSFSSSIRA